MPPRDRDGVFHRDEQTLRDATINRMSASTRDALDSVFYFVKAFAGAYDTSFTESLNAAWEKMGDDFELADEEEYVATDPISFDELMGGGFNDN